MDPARHSFTEQLDAVRAGIREMGALTIELIPRGTEILLSGDLTAAEELIIGDDEIDALSVDLEEQCLTILALQNPVASDLRRVVTAIHLNHEIERSADLVVNIAKGTRRLHGRPIDPALRGLIEQMGSEATRLFSGAMDAFTADDESLALALGDMDDDMDELHGDFIQALFSSSHASGDLQPAIQLALIGRYYERIGDHAVNIGERVAYMVSGWLPEHTGAARADLRARHDESAPSGNGSTG